MECIRIQGKQFVNLALTVLEIVAPAFLLATVGFAWVRLGFDYPVEFVTRIVMTISIPSLLFSSLVSAEISPAALSTLAAAAFTGYIVLSLVMVAVTHALGLDLRTYAAPLANGNTGNLGLPIALFAFKDQGLELALVVFAISGIVAFTYGVWITSGRAKLWKLVKDPMVSSVILAVFFMWQGWQIPTVVDRALMLAGDLSIPLMLITLGVAIAGLKVKGLGKAGALSILRVAICVTVAWAVGRWFNLPPVAFGVLVLQLSTPVAVTSYLIAQKYGADSQAVAGLVLISTLLSVITLPLTIAFLI